MNISMQLVYQYMAIFFNFSPTSNHLHPLQVENCDSNSRLVVDEDDNGKFRVERVNEVLILKRLKLDYVLRIQQHSSWFKCCPMLGQRPTLSSLLTRAIQDTS